MREKENEKKEVKEGRPVLSKKEGKRLAKAEFVLEKGDSQSYEKGKALREIRESRLYRSSFDTFDNYCRGKWDMVATRANQMIEFASVVDDLKEGLEEGEPQPIFERQARSLAPLSAERRVSVWRRAVESAGTKRVTAKDVEKALHRLRTPMPGKRTVEEEIPKTFPFRARVVEEVKGYISELASQHPGTIISFEVVAKVRKVRA